MQGISLARSAWWGLTARRCSLTCVHHHVLEPLNAVATEALLCCSTLRKQLLGKETSDNAHALRSGAPTKVGATVVMFKKYPGTDWEKSWYVCGVILHCDTRGP
jgi:hypothetical protein